MSNSTALQPQEPIKNPKSCSYKNFLSCICLVTILTIFCIAELAVMTTIFAVFASFYMIIAIFGGAYLLWLSARKVISHYTNKEKSTD
ncbi:hypothetical protein LO80_04210 [Candidatus Francisella endociliophora]|uniref:Uncharacterized protein n=1 Tax=Candidatus Francisella endociliophora TaxID=653937 RepID=A0A097ENW2_9GAMM|nr:hypothetical protein [Francisella sp. FSC1006]AIT09250.1 hypothetical protein LO80_04210 [Francisella sp. FSC1006]